MKRRVLLAHLKKHGCVLFREGAKHSIFYNVSSRRSSTVPRHSEVDDYLAAKICSDLGITRPD